ncbi:MAG: hypothetical protein H6626_00485 [Pseudobdellovibrionaceae bacterium]|nr:hypothetical protein [Bdellovibrionales bacterium]USN47601.1 MAG: hypothetical protein H6626_00485 [Pseudobdellovibrionaceae bacterium]
MALNNQSVEIQRQMVSEMKVEPATEVTPIHQSYVELPTQESSVYHRDGIQQLRANISQLQDLHSRLHFMVNEVSSLIKRRRI